MTTTKNTLQVMILDTETNGLPKTWGDYSDINMLELGWVVCDIDLNVVKEGNYLVKGNFDVPEIITKLTGITKEKTDLEGKPLDYVLKEFHEDLKKCEFIVAHNLQFDFGMMKKELSTMRNPKYLNEFRSKIQLDSLWMFRQIFKKPTIVNHRLTTIYDHLHPNENFIQTHRALDDVKMIISCMNRIDNFNLMNFYWNKPMNFGKYRGKKMTYHQVLQKDNYYYKNSIMRKFHKINPFKLKHFLKR